MVPTATHRPALAMAADRRRTAALWAARALMVLDGLALLAGATYFTFFAPASEGGVVTPVDWVVAVWALLIAVGYLAAAVRLRPTGRRTQLFALAMVAAHLAFGAVKWFGYGEQESVGFFVVDVVILAALLVLRRRS